MKDLAKGLSVPFVEEGECKPASEEDAARLAGTVASASRSRFRSRFRSLTGAPGSGDTHKKKGSVESNGCQPLARAPAIIARTIAGFTAVWWGLVQLSGRLIRRSTTSTLRATAAHG